MNAVEIEEAVSALAAQPFNRDEFPFAFLRAFGRKDVELKRLKANNASDVDGGVLRRDSIHMAVSEPGGVSVAMEALRASPKTSVNRVKFILATDGVEVQAEELASGDYRAFAFPELDGHFGFFLPLAGISPVRQIKDNPIDVKAVGRLNKLYLELLRENPDWGTDEKRGELNRLMARLVFCFFAEDTGIFPGDDLFTNTVRLHSEDRSGLTNTDQVLAQLFLAMATPTLHDGNPDERYRRAAGVKPYASKEFPYVNGGLFEDAGEVPKFSRAARNYLLHAGALDWKEINPDIFGSMIQAVADDEERGALGMHYTSVPNILKVLNPLFLDGLNEALAEAGDNVRKLRALRRRIGRIRVFDPACGSGNFLVIAYRQMREIEHEIVKRTGDDPKSVIPLTNFYGIEIKGFAVEVARLALLIAEFQADSRLISQQAARSMVLPLHRSGHIREGNALRIDWREVCPPTAAVTEEWDLGGPTGRLALEENGLGDAGLAETYICGNPPYLGSKKKNDAQIEDMVASGLSDAKLLDYACAFIVKATSLLQVTTGSAALVSTSSICQGEQVSLLWPRLLKECYIRFAYRPFKWSNSAARNAGVYCTIVGLDPRRPNQRLLYDEADVTRCTSLSPYLIPGDAVICYPSSAPISALRRMTMGSNPVDGTRLIFESSEYAKLISQSPASAKFFRPYGGTEELVDGSKRWCLWVEDSEIEDALQFATISSIVEECRAYRQGAGRDARKAAARPHAFCYSTFQNLDLIQVGSAIGNGYAYVPADVREAGFVSGHTAFAVYAHPGPEFAIIVSGLHRAWAEAVAGRLGNGVRYGNTTVYNTFPVPSLTTQDKADLSRCAEDILLAREAHFPATIAELYDPDAMPDDLRRAHDRNDETLERIYIGRRFRNDTERLEHLFALYTKMTASDAPAVRGAAKPARGRGRPKRPSQAA